MIEPKYLMLGDWVQVKNPSLGLYNVMGRIIAINEMEGHALSKTFDISFVDDEDHKIHYIDCPKYNVYPIPLTPEILGKNGFEDINDIYTARCTNIHYSCPIFIEYCCANNCLYINDGLIPEPILYVHRLQHAFRLCGIDKEITL